MCQHSATNVGCQRFRANESTFGRKTFNFRSTLTFTAENVIIFMILFWYECDAVQLYACELSDELLLFQYQHPSCIEREKVNAIIVGCFLAFGRRMHIKIWWRKRCEAMKSPFNSMPSLQRVCDIQYCRFVAHWKPLSEDADDFRRYLRLSPSWRRRSRRWFVRCRLRV